MPRIMGEDAVRRRELPAMIFNDCRACAATFLHIAREQKEGQGEDHDERSTLTATAFMILLIIPVRKIIV